MALQTTYSDKMAVAYAGMIATLEPNNLISREIETAAVGFGVAVKQGAADYGVAAATAASDVFRGITCRDQSTTETDAFAVGDTALVLQRGVVWVVAGAAVDAGDAAYMIVGTADAGKFTSVATDNLAIPQGYFDSSAAAGELVKLRIR